MTQNVKERNSAYGEKFVILDTPGTSSKNNKMMNFASLRLALCEGPLNGILVVIKYDRMDLVEDDLLRALITLSNYEEKIILVITYLDRAD